MNAFFHSVLQSFGPLAQNQVSGIETLLAATEGLPLRHRAYVLATAWHETGPASSKLHMTPRREIWGPTPAQQRYEGRADLGNTQPGDGKRFMGRGYVQITGRANYAKASKLIGKDMVTNPDLALDPKSAAKIIVHGMSHGWFTGKKMADFLNFTEMRRVVNGNDKAEDIAKHAVKFEAALKLLPAAPQPRLAEPVTAPDAPAKPEGLPAPLPDAGRGIAAILLGAAGALIAALATWIMKGN